MKHSEYWIFYSCGDCESQLALSMYQAAVLAQASRINNAKDFTIEFIKDEKGKEYTINSQMSFKRIVMDMGC